MKKIIPIILCFFAVFIALYLFKKSTKKLENDNSIINIPQENRQITENPSPTAINENVYGSYKNSWIVIRDLKKINLYSNLTEKLSSNDAKIKYNCESIISAGFYSEDYKNIGLFIGDDGSSSEAIKSDFFNGYFTLDNNLNPQISSNYKNYNIKIALQSGPLLFKDSKKTIISVKNDEFARRIILSKTLDNFLVFMVIYKPSNNLQGPKLEELGNILEEINKNTNIKIESAVNLDGGSHSVFDTDIVSIRESSVPGGYFCIQP